MVTQKQRKRVRGHTTYDTARAPEPCLITGFIISIQEVLFQWEKKRKPGNFARSSAQVNLRVASASESFSYVLGLF